MFEQSDTIDKFAPALAKVQATVEGAKKTSVNPHFKKKYADLSATWDACRDALTTNGFSVTQWPGEYNGTAMQMTTCLVHSSGQWQRGTMSIPLAKHDPQGYGSAVTYARRYALQAAVGLSPEDDDGNAASKPTQTAKQPEPRITPDQLKVLQDLVGAVDADLPKLCGFYRIGSLPELPASSFDHAKVALENKRPAKVAA